MTKKSSDVSRLTLPRVRSRSGFKNVVFDGRREMASKPWIVKRGAYRSSGFETPGDAAIFNALRAEYETELRHRSLPSTRRRRVPTEFFSSLSSKKIQPICRRQTPTPPGPAAVWMDKANVKFAVQECDLFGARLLMRRRRGGPFAKAVVKSWMPHAKACFGVVFDDKPDVVLQEDLFRRGRDDWQQTPWEGDIWQTTDLRPTCPQCLHPLDTGRDAWTRCTACGHMEPGVLSATVPKRVRTDDPYRRARPNYADVDTDDEVS